jgi:hypothetical protein
MSTSANQLKDEISRHAKKEVRAEIQSLKKATVSYRTEIAALKRCAATLEALVKKQGKAAPKVTPEAGTEEEGTSLRFRVAGFANLRKKLGVSAAEMGKLLAFLPSRSTTGRPVKLCSCRHKSIFPARSAFFSMKSRRGSTSSPMSMVNTRSASMASSICTRSRRRTVGSMVVSHSWAGFISPRPL